ncbi:MAG TPA: hypothetical protein VEH04_15430 [Verrucomicrobiae bacterium]|nr:hypothetical protein [Verrucomicrobiae bacterium]
MILRIALLLLSVAAAALLVAAFVQQRTLAELRSQEKALQLDRRAAESMTNTSPPEEPSVAIDPGIKTDLLRLRSEVGKLMALRKTLESVRSENEALKVQLAAKDSASSLPAGYVRTGEAQNVGMGTPKQTLETWLWAMRTRNREMALRVFTPEAADGVAKAFDDGDFRLPDWFYLIKEEPLAEGGVCLHLGTVPGREWDPMEVRFKFIGGGWRIAERF